jgi:predicted dehydrogenase
MLKVGIVGMGFMGMTHLAAWRTTNAEIVGMCSRTYRSDANNLKHYADYETLLSNVDVIDICTPTHLHHDMVVKAAAVGKHIVCEKPLARTVAEAQAMIDACKKAGVKLLVAHVVRFFPQYVHAKNVVDNGDIGDVAVVRLTRASFKPTAPDSWFHDEAKSGGMMLDLMIHDYDYARWVAGNVESVFAKRASHQFPAMDGDYALAILRHSNGAISNIEGGWVYPKPMFRTALEIAGSGGLIEHPADSSTPLGIYLKDTGKSADIDIAVPLSPLIEDPYVTEMKHFYDVLTKNIEPRVTAEDALEALKIALAAIESAKIGRRVKIVEVR